jgi:hypothetical protein
MNASAVVIIVVVDVDVDDATKITTRTTFKMM